MAVASEVLPNLAPTNGELFFTEQEEGSLAPPSEEKPRDSLNQTASQTREEGFEQHLQKRPMVSVAPQVGKEDPEKGLGARESASPAASRHVDIDLDRKQLILVIVVMALAIFLISLDETIIVTAIPKITDEFHSINDVGWYGSAYLLTMCCFQLHLGKIYKDYPTKKVFLSSIVIFEAGSFICGISPNSSVLIFGRALSGSGACGIVCGVLIIISKIIPLNERSLYLAFVSTARVLSGVMGPLIGGALTDSKLTWRWCFYINLPLGAIVVSIFLFFFRPPPDHREKTTAMQKLRRFDLSGLALFAGSMVCLILGLQFAGVENSWRGLRVILLLILSGVFFLAFGANEYFLGNSATIPLHIAKHRTVITISWFALLIDAPNYALAYYLPIYFQAVMGVSAIESGIRTLPQIVGVMGFSLMAGSFVKKTGYFAPVMVACTIVSTVGCGLLSTLKPNSGAGEWIGYQLIVGIGIGLGMQQSSVIVQHALSKEDIPLGIGIVVFAQTLGPVIMMAVVQTLFDRRLVSELLSQFPQLTSKEVFGVGVTHLTGLVSEDQQNIVIEAINDSLIWVWYSCLIVSACMLFPVIGTKWRKLA